MTMPADAVPREFDPSHGNFSAFDTESIPRHSLSVPAQPGGPRWLPMAFALFGGLFVLSFILVFVFSSTALIFVSFLCFLIMFVLGVRLAINQLLAKLRGTPETLAKQALLTKFAVDNGLLYRDRSVSPSYPGCLFAAPSTLVFAYNHFSTVSGRYIDFGNVHTRSEQGEGPGSPIDPNPFLNSWGFIAVEIDRQMPNILLIAKNRIGGATTLPAYPDPNQKLSLEGDFDKYFTLYCPKEFEQDALYFLTPDLMALLIDEVAPFDVEIKDSWLFFYVARPFSSTDPAAYQRIFRILETVGSKALRQTRNYTNPQLGPIPVEAPLAPGEWKFKWNPAVFGQDSARGTRLAVKRNPFILLWLGIFVLLFVGAAVLGMLQSSGIIGH